MRFGKDIAWDSEAQDLAVEETESPPDLLYVEEHVMIAQDIARSMQILKGSLAWDAEAGSQVPEMINDTADKNALKLELRRILKRDERIADYEIQDEGDRLRIVFRAVNASQAEELYL